MMDTPLQPGRLAAHEDAAATIHRELHHRRLGEELRAGKPIEVGLDGNVPDEDEAVRLPPPPGKLPGKLPSDDVE